MFLGAGLRETRGLHLGSRSGKWTVLRIKAEGGGAVFWTGLTRSEEFCPAGSGVILLLVKWFIFFCLGLNNVGSSHQLEI